MDWAGAKITALGPTRISRVLFLSSKFAEAKSLLQANPSSARVCWDKRSCHQASFFFFLGRDAYLSAQNMSRNSVKSKAGRNCQVWGRGGGCLSADIEAPVRFLRHALLYGAKPAKQFLLGICRPPHRQECAATGESNASAGPV